MFRYMLDTNMCVYLMKHHPQEVSDRFAQCKVGDVIMSSITCAELEFGVSVCSNPVRERQNLDALIELIEVKPFGADAARAYGPVRKATRDKKSDNLNQLIAAHAISLGAVLVTHIESDFAAYPALIVENWIER